MMDVLYQAVDYILGRTPRVKQLRAAVEHVGQSSANLRTSVNKLGEDVWSMVETGDPLRALVHGARGAQFQRRVESERRRQESAPR